MKRVIQSLQAGRQTRQRRRGLALAACIVVLPVSASFGQIQGASELHADADGDGVMDYQDRCGQTRPGAEVDEHGCADSDHDGILDPVDRCPASDPGAEVDAWGCADSDSDGVKNLLDRCPATPKGEQVFANGCAARQLPQLQAVYFAVDASELDAAALLVITDIARVLGTSAEFTLEVQGHADSSGPVWYNRALSQRRVAAVRAALINAGLPGERITTRFFGESAPQADNYSDEGRARNRRVSFQVKKRN